MQGFRSTSGVPNQHCNRQDYLFEQSQGWTPKRMRNKSLSDDSPLWPRHHLCVMYKVPYNVKSTVRRFRLDLAAHQATRGDIIDALAGGIDDHHKEQCHPLRKMVPDLPNSTCTC